MINYNGVVGVEMNKEIKLGIKVGILCIALFLMVLITGNLKTSESEKNSENDTELVLDTGLESDESEEVESESLETELVGSGETETEEAK